MPRAPFGGCPTREVFNLNDGCGVWSAALPEDPESRHERVAPVVNIERRELRARDDLGAQHVRHARVGPVAPR
jgi:hypothetical protein